MSYFDAVIQIGRYRFGFTHDMVLDNEEPYLERWILWCGVTLRLHRFLKSDDDRAFHDHPWWFVSLPLAPYVEITPAKAPKHIKPWRLHFRAAHHRHIVQLGNNRPVRTIILTGPKSREWGFWEGDRFVHHQEWLNSS